MQSNDKVFVPQKIVFSNQINKLKIKKIYSGSNRSYAILEQFVITWGQMIYKQENQQQINQKNIYYKIIPIKIDKLALGSNHTFAYTTTINSNKNYNKKPQTSINVYCWGSNLNYQLGQQEEKIYGLVNVQLFNQAFQAGFTLKQISCGSSHSLTILKDQQVGQTKIFGWGDSKSYQLALDSMDIIPYPVEIDNYFHSPVQNIQSKSDYNIATLESGEIYSWGCNMFNRLGLSSANINKNILNTSRNSINSKKIEAKQDNLLTDRNYESEQIKSQNFKIPKKIQIMNVKIQKIALGTYHALAISKQGEVFSWGNGIYGQLGNNKYGQFPPQRISKKHLHEQIKFKDCCAGQHYSCLLDLQGNIYSCGSNSYGILGHKKHENQTKKKRCKIFEKIDFFEQNSIKIIQFSCGNRHMVCLSQNNQIYGLGSNKYNLLIPQIKFQQNKFVQNEENYQIKKHKLFKQQRMRTLKSNQQNNENQVQDRIQKMLQNQLKIKNNNGIKTKLNQEKIILDKKYSEQKNNISEKLIQQVIDWKKRYKNFLIRKREQQDQLLNDLQQKINYYFSQK